MTIPCVVVGAGPAGLAASRALLDADVEHVVVERADVADTWRRQRWDGFRLNTPGWMNTMLGPVTADSFSTRDEVVRLLTERARNLPVRRHTPIVAVTRDAAAFVLQTPHDTIRATTVVLASGWQNVAVLPAASTRLSARVNQLHAADYRNADQLADGAVLVVGSGQSGSQIAEDLATAGRRVFLSTSRVGRYPWLYRGRQLIGWLVDCGHWDQRPHDLPDPAETRAAIAVVGSGGHDLDLTILAGLGVTLLGRLAAVDDERVVVDSSLGGNIAYGERVAALLMAKADAYIGQHSIDAPGADPRLATVDVGPAPVTELDLATARVTTVVWCSGFTADLSWVHLPISDDGHGLPRPGCASGVPGVWSIGRPWLTHRSSGILRGMPTDASTVVDQVLRYLGQTR